MTDKQQRWLRESFPFSRDIAREGGWTEGARGRWTSPRGLSYRVTGGEFARARISP